jgi:hypothetical protein
MAEAADQNKYMEDSVIKFNFFDAIQDRTDSICDAAGDKPEQAL